MAKYWVQNDNSVKQDIMNKMNELETTCKYMNKYYVSASPDTTPTNYLLAL
jgi:hypothetical protein